MTQYRIKTEQEFIEEFGCRWRVIVENEWISPEMDHLFGKLVETNDEQEIDTWSVSPSMITSLPLPTSSPKFGEWVDVNERLPEDYEDVLWIDKRDLKMHVGHFVFSQSKHPYVSNWMPLPAPPTKTNR